MSDVHPAEASVVEIDYDLDDHLPIDTATRMKALGDPLRLTIVDLVLERAMTVTELADRVRRPRGTVAHHVGVLVDAGLIRSVRTRKVRAVDEHFYGRVARTYVMEDEQSALPFLDEAIDQYDRTRDLPKTATFRHARIDAARADEYVARLNELALEFTAEPRSGNTEFGLLLYLFPTTRSVTP